MNISKWILSSNGKKLLLAIVVALIGYLLISMLVASKFSTLEATMRTQIADQTTILVAIAEATARNGGDQVTESIVQDCPTAERVQFDSLLNQLNTGLSRDKLVELDRLFGRCADTFAKRKAIMATRLTREVEVYNGYVEQLGVVVGKDLSEEFNVSEWYELTELEQNQSTQQSRLVQLQDRIIATLLEGKSVTSPEIVDILEEVKDARSELLMANLEAKEIRSFLVPL